MRQRYSVKIKDDEYWNMELEEGEITTGSDDNALFLRTKDGFGIRIVFKDWVIGPSFFNGYVSLPSTSAVYHLRQWTQDNPGYDDMNYTLDLNVELTFSNERMKEYGWDHGHYFDADFGRPLASQLEKRASGPVQVLEEARAVIAAMKEFEEALRRQAIDRKQAEMEVIREELMMKACHPRRIAAWAEQGFDPFEC
jgi:hypothetical protein